MSNRNENKASRRTIVIIWIVLAMLFLSGPFYVYCVSVDVGGLFGGMPGIKQLQNIVQRKGHSPDFPIA